MPILNADYSNINHDEMASHIGLNVKHIPILIKSFKEESSGVMTELHQAVQENDYDVIYRHAHFIKGSAGNLNFSAIYEMSKDMESNATFKKIDFDYLGYYNAIKDALESIK